MVLAVSLSAKESRLLPVFLQAGLIALSGLASVGSILLVILLLLSEGGRRTGLGYAVGYTSAYVLVGAGAVSLGSRAGTDGAGAGPRALPVLWVVVGALLIGVGVRNWRRPAPPDPGTPRILALVDAATPARALMFGAAISVVNVKNLALFLSATSVVVASDLALSQQYVTALLVALVFCLSVIVPVAVVAALPRRAAAVLGALRGVLTRHARPIGIAAPLAFGLLLLTRGTVDLT